MIEEFMRLNNWPARLHAEIERVLEAGVGVLGQVSGNQSIIHLKPLRRHVAVLPGK